MNDNGAGALLLGGGMTIVFALVGIAFFIFWIWALIDAIQNPALTSNERLIWILVIIFTHWIGALIYLLVGRKKGL